MNGSGKRPTRSHRISRMVRKNNQIEIPSTLDYLPKVDEFIEERLRRLGIKKDLIVDIAISVSEAVTNAVEHGNKNDSSKKVIISLKADSSRVEVTVEDEGGGFNPNILPSPIDDENLLKQQGRGVFILKSLMDEVYFSRGSKKGVKVKMVKLLN